MRVTVEEVERCWRTPAGISFRVRVTDDRRFTLTYEEAGDRWQVEPVRTAVRHVT
jgi:hypothetical protein